MRLLAHVTGWLAAFALLQLAIAELQRANWCDLPGWSGPGLYEHWRDHCPRPGVIVVRPI